MDPLFSLINKIDTYVNTEFDNNKIENLITSDEYYSQLSLDEQVIVMETLAEKLSFKSMKKNKEVNNDININEELNPLTEGEIMSSRGSAIILETITNEEFVRRENIFNNLRSIVLPEQRSPEWFAMRSGKITASDGGTVLGKNKYEAQYNFILKKVLGSTFETNEACYHGKKFENAVTLTYELVNNTKTEEFGLLGHPDYYFLGASPDGICAPVCRDDITPNPLVGRMLEIKCPLMRKIKYKGDIIDTICPIYYWCQVQLQLECCDLDECDFIQCNIEEYINRTEWINDTNSEYDYKSIKYNLERGVLLEILPAKLEDNDYKNGIITENVIYDKAIFIYPPKIDMTNDEIDKWILNELEILETKKFIV